MYFKLKKRIWVLNQTYPKIMKKAILLTLLFFELKKDASGKVVDKVYQGDKVSQDFMEWLGRN